MAFDIESPQNFDTTPLSSFTIGCAGTVRSDGEKKTWFNASQSGRNNESFNDVRGIIYYPNNLKIV